MCPPWSKQRTKQEWGELNWQKSVVAMCKMQVILHGVSQICITLCSFTEQLLGNNRTPPPPKIYHPRPQYIDGLNRRMFMSQNRQNISRRDTQCVLKSTDVYAPQTTVLSVEAKRGKTEPLSTLYRHRSDSVRESFAQLNPPPPHLAQSADQRDRGYHWKRMKCREEKGENRKREREFPFHRTRITSPSADASFS